MERGWLAFLRTAVARLPFPDAPRRPVVEAIDPGVSAA
jgi:hypothetical protein